MPIQQFRNALYQSVLKREDGFFNLLDALTVAGHVNSPVALSEEAPFERKFSSIFDTLLQAKIDFDQLLRTLYEFQPADAEQIAGFEIYAHDTTPNERPEAETLEDRGSLKAQKDEPVRYGHKYSWLVRLVNWGTSWVAPVDVQRVATSVTNSQIGAVQVQEPDMQLSFHALRSPSENRLLSQRTCGGCRCEHFVQWNFAPNGIFGVSRSVYFAHSIPHTLFGQP